MNWKRIIVAAATWKKYHAFINDTCHPEHAKNRLWNKEILPLIQQTSFWRQSSHFNKTQSLDSFAITTYNDYESSLIAALHSTKQPFNNEEIIYWAETSATSGKRKYFPITTSFQRQFQRTMTPFFHSLIKRFPDFLNHKILYLAAYSTEEVSPAGVPMGFISHFNYHRLPPLIKSFYALPSEVFADSVTFHQWAPLYALAHDLSALFAITPMAIEAFYTRCSENLAFYLPYLLGQKSLPAHLPSLKISKKRQEYLRHLNYNSLSYQTLWPTLTLSGCWIAGPCQPFAYRLVEQMGNHITLVDGAYSATEGWMTVPIETEHRGGILHPGAHIVEFIEEGKDIKKEHLLQSWELKQGKQYEIFLTTAMGFVRYQLKDIVKCTGFYNRAPRLEFCYKSAQIRLDVCTISEQELRCMLQQVNLEMETHWFFCRDSRGDKLILVTDTETSLNETVIQSMHKILLAISEPYAYSVRMGEIRPLEWRQLPKERLLKNSHAQSKPKLISQEILE
ncbi:GH3 family domain-containing protein [Legionella nagasakiensis]|uniref:GH3 family domain-containing protein n=1 Tax=Legionella nagasakiensis TaxID=535290 RepID=UPI00105464FE|nr:GH3 auxin-responsive promoter family protein [Legionella nagasakiensis]